MQFDTTLFFPTPIHTCNHQTPNPYLWLDLPIILNTILLDHEFHHRSFFEGWAIHECTFTSCSSIYNGCSVIGRCLIMSVLTLYHVKIQHKIVSKTISPNIIALHQQHKSYMYPNAIYCCNLKSIKVNWSMAKKKRNIKANATKNWKNIIHECYIWKKNNQHPHSCWKYLIVFKMQAKNMKKYYCMPKMHF
jgi:hypothetical protein